VFLARVKPDGTVTDIQLQQSTNSKTLDHEAEAAMKNWRFLPGQEGMIRKAFQFSLNGNAQEIPARLRR
jgi:TonB family protein